MKFAQEVFGSVTAGMPWATANGPNGNAAGEWTFRQEWQAA